MTLQIKQKNGLKMRWKYDYSDEFKKKLGKIDHGSRNIVFKRICKIIDDPYRGKPLSHDLSGRRSERFGKFRVIYKIRDGIVYFITLDHRGGVYKKR